MMFSMMRVVMVISLFFGSFAALPESWRDITSGELTFRVETKLNQPLDEIFWDEADILGNISADFDIKYKTSEDLKKLEMQLDMLLSIGSDEPMQLSCWGNLDLTDRNIPKVLLIFKNQYDDKFNVLNIQYPTIHGGMETALKFLNADLIDSVIKNITESLNKNSINVVETEGALSAILDDSALKDVFKQLALSLREYIAPYFGVNMMPYGNPASAQDVAVIGSSDGPTAVYISPSDTMDSQFKSVIDEFFAKFENVQIFNDKALEFNMTTDDNNLPKNINYTININTNLYELAKTFGENTGASTKENSVVDMSINFDYSYSKINEDIVIDYPELTAENSIDEMSYFSQPGIDINNVNIIVNNDLTDLKNKPFIKDGIVYLPLRETLNLKGISDENIIWDNGIVKVSLPYLSTKIMIDSDEIIIDGQTINVRSKALLIDNTTFIPLLAFGELSLGGMTNTFFDDNGNIIGCVISIHRYLRKDVNVTRFLVSNINPEWEEYLQKAADMAGAKIEIIFSSADQHLERTNLVIASGDPMVIVGNYSDEFINNLMEMNVIYPVLKIDDEYSIIIPKVIENLDMVTEIAKNFISLASK